MTTFTFFGLELLRLHGALGFAGLVVASWALAGLSVLPWEKVPTRVRRTAHGFGATAAVVVAVVLAAGVRLSGTAWDPGQSPRVLEWLTALVTGAGLAATAWAATGLLAGLVAGRERAVKPPPVVALDEVGRALQAYESLREAAGRLGKSHAEATTRALGVTDAVASAEYTKAGDAIRNRLQLAEELQATTGAAVLRLACAAPLRRLLEHRPDAALARLNDDGEDAPLVERVEDAQVAVGLFLGELTDAEAALEQELLGAPGSVAARVGLDAAERARPFAAAVDQLALTYGRVGHRLEALRLRLSAEADAGVVAGAAMALTSGETQPAAAQDVVAVAVEISQAEQSAVTALATLGAAPSRIADVVLNASASLARDTGDDEGLADVLRSVRRELER